MKSDPRLEQIQHELTIKAEVLLMWLDRSFAYSSVSVFMLCGALVSLIEDGWPDDDERPEVYRDLIAAIHRLAQEVGPMIAAVELEDRPVIRDQAVCERQRKTRKKTIN